MKPIHYILLLLVFFNRKEGYSQILIDKSVVFSSDSSARRQIENIRYPSDSTELVKTEALMAGYLNYYTVLSTDGDTIKLGSPIPINLVQGTRINFLTPFTNSGKIFIKVNTNQAFELVKNTNASLSSNDIINQTITSIIYDGTRFQLTNSIEKSCPSGYTEVNENLCIKTVENTPAVNFYDASINCQSSGARLCTWGEWHYACQKAGLGLVNMTNNYEWIDSSANASGVAAVVGLGGCQVSNVNSAAGSLRTYRCCFSK